MNLTYQLTETGYQVFLDGKLWVDQPFNPEHEGFVPFTAQEAQAAALAFIAQCNAQ